MIEQVHIDTERMFDNWAGNIEKRTNEFLAETNDAGAYKEIIRVFHTLSQDGTRFVIMIFYQWVKELDMGPYRTAPPVEKG